MNAKDAKQIPVKDVAEYFGATYSHNDARGRLWYHSPFRPDERTASFVVDEHKNTWHDFARQEKINAHGTVIDLWIDYHNRNRRDTEAVSEAIKFLEGFSGTIPQERKFVKRQPRQIDPDARRYEIVSTSDKISSLMLKDHLSWRKLTIPLASEILKQSVILDKKTQKKFYAFSMENIKGGYEICKPQIEGTFKTCIGNKGVSVIRHKKTAPWLLFEGFWDYLAYAAMNEDYKENNHIVLHSVSNIASSVDVIIEHEEDVLSVHSYFDNDPAGEAATLKLAELLEPKSLPFGDRSHLYKDNKDLCEYWQQSPNAKLAPRVGNKVYQEPKPTFKP